MGVADTIGLEYPAILSSGHRSPSTRTAPWAAPGSPPSKYSDFSSCIARAASRVIKDEPGTRSGTGSPCTLAAHTNGNGHGEDGTLESYLVPCELGDLLQAFIWDDDRSVEETFTLRGHLARLVDRRDLPDLLKTEVGESSHVQDHAEAAEALADSVSIATRSIAPVSRCR